MSTKSSPSRSPLPLIVAVAGILLLAVSPLHAQVEPIEPFDYSGGPGIGPIGPPEVGDDLTSRAGAASTAMGPTTRVTAQSGSGADPFFLIQKTIVMKEEPKTLPMPVYELVDVEGTFKNAPGSVACGGTTSEGVAEDADACQLLNQLTFSNGYLNTSGTITTPNATTYNGETSILVVGHVGDVVQLTVKNEQPEAVNEEAISTGFFAPADNKQIVHWHGMELDNESDGTPVTEAGIETGEQRLYQYRLYRPGVYWFHPHVKPLLTESRGMVGRLVVRSYEEDFLSLVGVLPLTQYVFQLKDSTIANEFNKDAYRNGTLFEDFFTPEEVENNLMPDISPDLNGDGVCDRGPGDCIVKEGEYLFVNGVIPTSDENIPTILVPEGRGARVAFINSSVERFFRFRLLLEGEEPPGASGTPVPAERTGRATTGQCYAPGSTVKFSGADPLSCDQGLIMYRVGGQNGLLDHARVEGQPELAPGEPARAFDTVIRRGEDFIGVAERTEFVIVTKDREGNYLEPGESMYIWTIDYPHGIFTPKFDNNIGDGDANNRDVAPRKLVRIKIIEDEWGLPNYNLTEGAPLMAHPWVNRPAENIKTAVLDQLSPVPLGIDPFLGVPFEGLEHGTIMLGNEVKDGSRFPSVNSVKGDYMGFGIAGDQIPTQEATRYARTEDVIEFVYANNTGAAHHPFHMHGFSFQPISLHSFQEVDSDADGIPDTVTLDEPPLHVFDYNEFIDIEVMQPGVAMKYRMKMNDRFKIPDETKFTYSQLRENFPYDYQSHWGGSGDLEDQSSAETGGALGRWLFHCHILHHAEMGMTADLCIASHEDPDASGCKIDVDEEVYEPIP
ncbi:MAG TPA: multicopper oxidase domain-containing protein [Solirubrobacterales bacterium]|nr:multicopper oxidase domain-containing protein [Solirubrobacterales bacterium]